MKSWKHFEMGITSQIITGAHKNETDNFKSSLMSRTNQKPTDAFKKTEKATVALNKEQTD